jgi:hypothetical protein
MRAAETLYPRATRFVLFTGASAAGPLALYSKLGYKAFRTQKAGSVDIVWLAKERQSA